MNFVFKGLHLWRQSRDKEEEGRKGGKEEGRGMRGGGRRAGGEGRGRGAGRGKVLRPGGQSSMGGRT